MSITEYPACVHELYQSEVLGEAIFLALLKVAKNEREKYHFGTALQLETETKARLRPFMFKYGFDLVEDQDSELSDGIVAAYQEASWVEFLAGLKPLVNQFVERFQDIAAAGPAQDQAVLQSMITHEASFVSWIDKELAGEEGSLDAIICQLQFPLSAV